MAKRGKRYDNISQKVDKMKVYTPEEALDLVFETKSAKFVETVELAIRLGVDPRHADQQVRGTVSLPNGTGKTVRILAITSGENIDKALAAGADFAGDDEYIKNMKIKEIQKKYNVEDSINKIDLNGEEWEEIYDELTLPSFLSTNKIITIYQAETNIFNDKNEKDDLNLPSPYTFFEKILTNESYKNEILEDLAIIIVFDNKKISKKNKLYKYITKKNDIVKISECSKLPRIENEKYLLDIAKEKKLNIGMNEIKFLVELVEKNTYMQVNELMKLCFLNKAILRRKNNKR